MSRKIDLSRLQRYFSNTDIDWKPVRYTPDRKRAMVVPYLTNRAIMDRLDEVCGPENWMNRFSEGPGGGVLCGLSIRVDDEWITKWDGAGNTEVEAVKGGLSSSMRRAAVQWGIGRYLYRLPAQWISVDEKSRFLQPPVLPPAFHPAYSEDGSDSSSLRPYSAEQVDRGKNGKAVRRMAAAAG